MADIDRLLKATRPLEAALRRRGGQGRGLHGLVSSLESTLSADLVKQLRWLATLRNKAVHEDDFKVPNIAEVEASAAQALRRLGHSRGLSLIRVELAPPVAKKVWCIGVIAATGGAYLSAAPTSSPGISALIAGGLAAWVLRPSRQPMALALVAAAVVLAVAANLSL